MNISKYKIVRVPLKFLKISLNFFKKVSPNVSMSPCVLNFSNQGRYLMPGGNKGRNFSPMNLNNSAKTPNLSPIVKPATPLSETKFLRRRDAK